MTKYLGRFLAILAAFFLIVTLPCATWMLSTGQMLLDADSYKNALANENVYADLIPALLPAIAEGEHNPDTPEALTLVSIVGNLDANDWRRIAELLVPPQWLRTQVENNLDIFIDWLNDDIPTPNLRFDTGLLRERLTGREGQQAVNLIMGSWPPCTDEQLDVLLNYDDRPDAAFPFCQPSGEYVAVMSEALANILREQANHLPDEFPPPDWLENNAVRRELNNIKLGVRWAQTFVIELWILAAGLLSLIVFFTVRSLKSFGQWSGVSLLLSGIAAVIPVPFLLSPFLLPNVLVRALSEGEASSRGLGVTSGLGNADSYLEVIAQGVTRSIIGEILMPVLILAAVLIVLGFLGLIISVLTRYPDEAGNDLSTFTPTPTPTGNFTPTGHITPTGQMLYTLEQTPTPGTPSSIAPSPQEFTPPPVEQPADSQENDRTIPGE